METYVTPEPNACRATAERLIFLRDSGCGHGRLPTSLLFGRPGQIHPARMVLLGLLEGSGLLDTENERLIQEVIHRLHGELTVVVIAHRLSHRAQSRLDYCAELRRNRRARDLAIIALTAWLSLRGNGAGWCIIMK